MLALTFLACAPPPIGVELLEADLARHDVDEVLTDLPPDPGLRRWLTLQATSDIRRGGHPFQVGDAVGLLGAELVASPGRWSRDRWPLGVLLDVEPLRSIRGDGPRRIVGQVAWDRDGGAIEGDLWVWAATPHGVVTFTLQANVLDATDADGRALDVVRRGETWVVEAASPVHLRYRGGVKGDGHDLLTPEVVLLTDDTWLPAPLPWGVAAELEVRVSGAADLQLRGGNAMQLVGDDWLVSGDRREHSLLVGRRAWTVERQTVGDVVLEVATAPGDTGRHELMARAAEALEALADLGPFPPVVRISSIPPLRANGRPRAPHATLGGHVTFPEGSVRRLPLSVAHEFAHVLYGEHDHPVHGVPDVEEAVAEHLSLRAARTPGEVRARRAYWQSQMRKTPEAEERSLLDPWARPNAQYWHGALVLDAVAARIGEAELVELLQPGSGRGVVRWNAFAEAVAENDPATGVWLHELLEAPTVTVGVADFIPVDGGLGLPDAGETGLADDESDAP